MMIIDGDIVPGVQIGNYVIGTKKEIIVSSIQDDYKVWERGDGFCIFTFDNFKLWFDKEGVLFQIGVTKGFLGNFDSIHIGSTMQDIIDRYGNYKDDGDEYLLPDIDGICFELEDVDDWDELTAPIEWIFVYMITGG